MTKADGLENTTRLYGPYSADQPAGRSTDENLSTFVVDVVMDHIEDHAVTDPDSVNRVIGEIAAAHGVSYDEAQLRTAVALRQAGEYHPATIN